MAETAYFVRHARQQKDLKKKNPTATVREDIQSRLSIIYIVIYHW